MRETCLLHIHVIVAGGQIHELVGAVVVGSGGVLHLGFDIGRGNGCFGNGRARIVGNDTQDAAGGCLSKSPLTDPGDEEGKKNEAKTGYGN